MNSLFKNFGREELEELARSMAWNDGFGCYTRKGLEKMIWPEIIGNVQYCVFIDVDDMHGLNERHGYDGVNLLIKNSLLVRSTDYVAGQWFSGDEFVVLIAENEGREESDVNQFCERLQYAFAENGISITIGVSDALSPNLMEVVKPAFDLVQEAKRLGRRGTINDGSDGFTNFVVEVI